MNSIIKIEFIRAPLKWVLMMHYDYFRNAPEMLICMISVAKLSSVTDKKSFLSCSNRWFFEIVPQLAAATNHQWVLEVSLTKPFIPLDPLQKWIFAWLWSNKSNVIHSASAATHAVILASKMSLVFGIYKVHIYLLLLPKFPCSALFCNCIMRKWSSHTYTSNWPFQTIVALTFFHVSTYRLNRKQLITVIQFEFIKME